MTLSYQWLHRYLPFALDPQELSHILTSIGLEVESLEKFEQVKGNLDGVVIGHVLTCVPHPNADKLRCTTVDVGQAQPLSIVCGAANVAAGQKVVVALVGTTLYPMGQEPLTLKKAKIRGEESQGMICAEDELGLGSSHEGILVLPDTCVPGTPAAAYFKLHSDWVYEIGLTPNRMDAMSHLGVAKDLCAYLSHHGRPAQVKNPLLDPAPWPAPSSTSPTIQVQVMDQAACPRYAGVCIEGLRVGPSPTWLVEYLSAIGQRPINNVVDITNFILHETGQPLHAFDLSAIGGQQVVVRKANAGEGFTTLDSKERKLDAGDLLIADAQKGMCLAGVFGGIDSGVGPQTQGIFLESACFAPSTIRKTSLRHGLRTDAATRFEKGVDISQTLAVLKRAALLICEVAGGQISSAPIDVYPAPAPPATVTIRYDYLTKLSGKVYPPETVVSLLENLGFTALEKSPEALRLAVPFAKPDIALPADIVEEVLRIDGLDNVAIPSSIRLSPAQETIGFQMALREKITQFLVGQGATEILTNSISNSRYYAHLGEGQMVRMINNLSAELDVLRPSLMESGLEVMAHNLNRRQQDLQLFELGKTYHPQDQGFQEKEVLGIWVTGLQSPAGWRQAPVPSDFHRLKSWVNGLLDWCGIGRRDWLAPTASGQMGLQVAGKALGHLTPVSAERLAAFDLKQAAWYFELDFALFASICQNAKVRYKEVSRFPAVDRDLAIVVDQDLPYARVEKAVLSAKLPKLQSVALFDVFKSEKLGPGKQSLALHFSFEDEQKTLTDAEIDGMMQTLVRQLEKDLGATIRQ